MTLDGSCHVVSQAYWSALPVAYTVHEYEYEYERKAGTGKSTEAAGRVKVIGESHPAAMVILVVLSQILTVQGARMDPDFGEVLFECRAPAIRRIALSVVLVPIGLALVVWSFVFAGFCIGIIEVADWRGIPAWFLPVPLGMGSLCLFAVWWYVSRELRCHKRGISMRGPIRTQKLAFGDMTGVRMRLTETQDAGVIPMLWTLEVWFDPVDANRRSIAFTHNGVSSPLEIANRITSIVESAGITPVWGNEKSDKTTR